MKARFVPLAGIILVGGAAQAPGQVPLPVNVEFAVHAGGTAFGDFHDHGVVVIRAGETDGRTYRRSITARTSSALGAAATIWIHPLWGVRLHHASVQTRFVERYEEEAERLLSGDPGFLARPSPASLAVTMLDMAVVFRVPARAGELGAYALAGIGRLRYSLPQNDAGTIPAGAADAFDVDGRFNSFAGVGGVGAHYPFGRIRLLAEVTNHIGRSPVRTVGEREVFVSDEFVVRTVPSRTGDPASPAERSERVNALQVTLGLTVSLP